MKSKNWLLIFLIFFNELFNNIILFGFPLRLMIIFPLLFLISTKTKYFIRKYYKANLLYLYLFYCLFILVAMFINGNLDMGFLVKKILGYLTVTILYFLILSNINIDLKNYSKLKSALLILAILHFCLIILQFFDNDISWIIPEYFSNDFNYLGNGTYSYVDKKYQTLPVGLIDFSVTAGYIILIFCPLYLLIKQTTYKAIFITLLICSTLALGQRSVVILVLFFLILNTTQNLKNLKTSHLFKFIILAIILSIVDLDLSNLNNMVNSRLLTDFFVDENRSLYIDVFNIFKNENFIYGGKNIYLSNLSTHGIEPHMPHNLFLNSWVLGGFFCFILSIALFYYFLKYLYLKVKEKNSSCKNMPFYPLFYSCILLILNSLFHNQGFSTFDNNFFLIFSLAHLRQTYYG